MINKKNIKVNSNLLNFINNEVLKNLDISEEIFWEGFSDIVDTYFPKNIDLLETRKSFQHKINEWHRTNKSKSIDVVNTKNF